MEIPVEKSIEDNVDSMATAEEEIMDSKVNTSEDVTTTNLLQSEGTSSSVIEPRLKKEEPHCESNTADNCDICINTNKIAPEINDLKKNNFELKETVNSQEETDDESDDEEMQQFLSLMNKAERKNHRKISAVQTFHLGQSKEGWRNVHMEDPESDTEDTDDEDDTRETQKFLSLMEKKKNSNNKQMVTIKWQDGRVTGLPAGIRVTRGPPSEDVRRRQEEELLRRKRQHLEMIRREGPATTTCSGKRKFEDRMTLSEAKADDFTDTKDYVDFIQAKLKGVNIKIIK